MNETNLKPCTVCGGCQAHYLFDKMGDGSGSAAMSLYRCSECNTVYLGEYDDDYDDGLYEYYEKYKGRPKDALYNPLTVKSYLKVLELFSKNTTGSSILDVGCGKGDFVDAALHAGWDINGIELAQPAVDIAQGYGLPVHQLDFFSKLIPPASRDIVTLFEVMEHLPNPGEFLTRAEEVVKPGGLVYLTTPNYDSLDRRLLGANWPVIHRQHLTYFTPETLVSSIQNNTNLKVLHCETRNLSVRILQEIKQRITLRRRSMSPSASSISNGITDIRSSIESSTLLKIIKRGINWGLNATSTGNTIVLLLKRPL